jgi:5-methylcytosine-specific restriction protein A
MPSRAKKPCAQVGCAALVPGSVRHCNAHQREPWFKDEKAPKRITGRRLQKLRRELIARDPLCAECKKEGKVTLGTQRDHVLALAHGGRDDESNVQLLCDAHHDAKSKAERLRGRGGSKGWDH